MLKCDVKRTTSFFNWTGEDVTGATVQVMVIGAGDPRHLLVTLARKHRRRLRVGAAV